MKHQKTRNAMLGLVLISILICGCQKEHVINSNGSLFLDASSYELKSAYYTNNMDSSYDFGGGELILAGPTIYFDSPSGFFNSNGKSAFIIIGNSELSSLRYGEYELIPDRTMIHIDANPKPTDSLKNIFWQPVGDVIEAK